MKTGDFPTNNSRGPKSQGMGPPLRPRTRPCQQHPPGRSHQPCCREQPGPPPVATANTTSSERRRAEAVRSRALTLAPTRLRLPNCVLPSPVHRGIHGPGCSVLIRRRCKSFSRLGGSRKGWNHPVWSSAPDSARAAARASGNRHRPGP